MTSDVRISLGNLLLNVSSEKILTDNCEFRYSIFYEKDALSELSILCDNYGSDKGEIRPSGHPYAWPSHTYADFYEARFAHCREHIRSVFECGSAPTIRTCAATWGFQAGPARRFASGATIFRKPTYMAPI